MPGELYSFDNPFGAGENQPLGGTPASTADLAGTPGEVVTPGQAGINWSDVLKSIMGLSGGSSPQQPFSPVGVQSSKLPGQDFIYRIPPVQAFGEQKKQTSAGEVEQYAKILKYFFG